MAHALMRAASRLVSMPVFALMLLTASASAQTLSIVSGDSQVAAQNFQLPSPLVVVAKDSAGRPVANVSVNWSISGPGNLVLGTQTLTDSNGQATNRYVGATIFGDTAYTQSTITASTASSNVSFHETTSGWDTVSGLVFVQAQVISPNLGDTISGASGSTGATPVQINVYGIHNAGVQQVPNVSIRLVLDNPGGPSVACAQGSGVTDVNGIANCRVLFSGPAGNGTFSIEVGGGFRTFSPFKFTVTQGSGQPSVFRITITGGNNQSGPPGAQLPARLTARVEDAGGNPLPNVTVVWQPVNPQAVSLSGIVSTSDASGIVSATATLGSGTGPAQVQVSANNGAVVATFSLAVGQSTPPPTGGGSGVPAVLRITGGNNQSGPAGSRLPAPLTARVEDANGNPLANVPVIWSPSTLVSLSNVVSTSDANGNVSAIATFGSTAGAAQVQLRTVGTGQTPFDPSQNVIQTLFNLTVTGGSGGPPVSGQPATLRILSGNNQSGPPGARLPSPLTARVEDAAGNPLANVPVIWETPASVTLSGASSVSDGSGIVSATATLGAVAGAAQVTLRTTGGIQTPFGTTPGVALAAPFTLVVTQPQPGAPATLRILGGNNQSGAPGAQLTAQLVVRVEDAAGNPLSGITVGWQPTGVTLITMTSTSDANGIVSATARLGSTAGPAQVQVRIPNTQIQVGFSLTAVQPQPATLRILDGNNQTGPPGRQLPVPLTARVEDAAGNPVPNVAVIWQALTPQSVSLGSSAATSDANGIVSAIAVLGAVGPAQVLVRVPNLAVQTSFSLVSVLTLTGITILSGIDQVATVGASFAQPIVVQLLAAEGPAAGMQVQLGSISPSVIIPNAGVAVTDANGRAIISIQAGSSPGTALVTASAGAFSISFFLTVRPAEPTLASLSFFNAASGQQSAVSPTAILAIYGAGLAQGLQGCATGNQVLGPLPLVLSGVRVQFVSDGYSAFAPLYAVCNLGPGQEYVVVETPADLPLVETTVTVQVGSSPVAQSKIAAAPAAPGIFETVMSDGVKRAVLQRLDGSYVSLESPAQRSERLRAFVTGLGRAVKASGALINTNQSGTPDDDASPPNLVSLRIAGNDISPASTIYGTETIGVYIVTFDVPDNVPSGADVDLAVATTLGDQPIIGKTSKLPIQ